MNAKEKLKHKVVQVTVLNEKQRTLDNEMEQDLFCWDSFLFSAWMKDFVWKGEKAMYTKPSAFPAL